MANLWSAPCDRNPEDIPSSGEMVKEKLRRSLGSGKSIVIVEGRSSSVISASSREADELNDSEEWDAAYPSGL